MGRCLTKAEKVREKSREVLEALRRKGHAYDEVSESDASSSSKASLSQFIMDQVALKATEDAKARRAAVKQEQRVEAS